MYAEIDDVRRRQRLIRGVAIAAGLLAILVFVVIIIVATRDGGETTATDTRVELFECPDDPRPIAMANGDDLEVEGIDQSGTWLLIARPLPELPAAWVRAADLDVSRTSLSVRACKRVPEPTPEELTAPEPTVTATPTPAPTAAPLPTPRPNEEVAVIVLNASGIEGAAGRVTQALDGAGFATGVPGNSDGQPVSEVFYAEGFEAEGMLVAQLLEIDEAGVSPQGDDTPAGADVVVLLGES